MAELENLLLQAAGRTGTSGRKNNSRQHARWRREGSSYSDGSDSKDDDSDNPDFTTRKASGSQFPLKKRLDPPEKENRSSRVDDDDDDDGQDGNDSDDSAPSVGSDLYKDEADKEELGKLSELQREMILAERGAKIDDYRLKRKARASSSSSKIERKKTRKGTPPPLLRGRSSVRSDKTAAKDDALNELRAKRMKQQDSEGYRKLRDAESSLAKRRAASVAESSSSESSGSGSGSDSAEDGVSGDKDLADSEDDESTFRTEVLTFEDIKGITIRRSKLGKWFMEPFFEELIVGCFVRVGIGMSRSGHSIYRLCLVRNVDASDPDRQYKLESRTTYKYLNCIWGNEASAARWQMAMVSDSPPLEEEFKAWVREVERGGGRMLNRQDVLDKKEAIQKISNFVYSAATVKQMLQEKKSASSRPLNVAAEKDRLRKEMEVAESRRDEVEVERVRARMKELEDMSSQVKKVDAKAVRLAEMNRRNRAENFKNASEMKPVNTSLKAGEAGYDPFSRRWTRSRNYYVSKPGGEGEGAAANGDAGVAEEVLGETNGVGPVPVVEAGEAATAAALEAAAGAGKLVDTSAPVDQGTESNSLHNFDLKITLSELTKYGGPQGVQLGFMARKQKIEAMIGYKVPENDGKRHTLTLTVSDYKRRRGLL